MGTIIAVVRHNEVVTVNLKESAAFRDNIYCFFYLNWWKRAIWGPCKVEFALAARNKSLKRKGL